MSTAPALFSTYTQLPTRMTQPTWACIRRLGLAGALIIIVLSLVAPSIGLTIFWGLYVPSLPLVFLVAPGLWRNVCPMATLNQIPRRAGFTRGWTVGPRVQQISPLISAGLFLPIVIARKAMLDRSGPALAAFLVAVLCLAFLGGVLFKGKSGWCSQFCPMLQVERFYGQSPLKVVPNAHCRPCVGCTKHCYDFNPTAAYLQDIHDPNRRLGANRTLFAGALPGLVVSFFTQPTLLHPTFASVVALYGRSLLFVAAGVGLFKALEAVGPFSSQQLVLIAVALTFSLFYYFVVPITFARFGMSQLPAVHPAQVGTALLATRWLARAWPRERAFLQSEHAPARTPTGLPPSMPATARVSFANGPTVTVTGSPTVLDLALDSGIALSAGCRIGMCGADPVWVVAGADALSQPTQAERGTLERLGLGPACRLACCARVQGDVTVALERDAVPEAGPPVTAGEAVVPQDRSCPAFEPDPAVGRVVIIGGGVAGITVATEVRRLQPHAEITLLSAEPYDAYNRMAVDRLLGTGTLGELYLLPRDWAAQRRIRAMHGVRVTAINRAERTAYTRDGARFPYDRLVLATGAGSAVPTLDGYGIMGSFVLRTADDALQMRAYIAEHRPHRAVILGGGPVGLESADRLRELGLAVTVLYRNPWPLARNLDRPAGSLLLRLLAERGIEVISHATACRLVGSERLKRVICADGLCLDAELCVVAAGIAPNTALARAAGLTVRRGVVVDDQLRTSDPRIFAVGDAAEHEDRIAGLWQASVEQARLAAVNLLGGDVAYRATSPTLALKVSGIDLQVVGVCSPVGKDGIEVRFEDTAARTYRKLVVQAGVVCGAAAIGDPEMGGLLARMVTRRVQVGKVLPALKRGDWSVVGSLLCADDAHR